MSCLLKSMGNCENYYGMFSNKGPFLNKFSDKVFIRIQKMVAFDFKKLFINSFYFLANKKNSFYVIYIFTTFPVKLENMAPLKFYPFIPEINPYWGLIL